MSSEIVRRDQDAFELGKVFKESGMFPTMKQEAEAVVKILAGREFGLGPLAAMQGIHMVDGKPTLAANLIAGQIKRHPHYDYRVIRRDETGCELEFFERGHATGQMESVGTMTFDRKDANAANLLGKQNWKKYPRDMFFARCLTAGARTFCPDVLGGSPVYTAEELGAEDAQPQAAPTSGVAASTVPVSGVKVTGEGQPDGPIQDAVVVEEKPAEASSDPAKAIGDKPVDDDTLKQISAAAKTRWPDRTVMRDQLKWQLIGLEGIEFDANDEDPALLTRVMSSLRVGQALELLKRLEGDADVPGSGATA